MIRIKRVYEPAEPNDGTRILIDRLWPRGIRKEPPLLDLWHKEAAPSNQLRVWFSHDPARWDEFKKRYFAELDNNPKDWESLIELARSGNITLLYSAKNKDYNNAVALKDYLESKL
jgi:uncharacterized protein YeaO (DUF488 family)